HGGITNCASEFCSIEQTVLGQRTFKRLSFRTVTDGEKFPVFGFQLRESVAQYVDAFARQHATDVGDRQRFGLIAWRPRSKRTHINSERNDCDRFCESLSP